VKKWGSKGSGPNATSQVSKAFSTKLHFSLNTTGSPYVSGTGVLCQVVIPLRLAKKLPLANSTLGKGDIFALPLKLIFYNSCSPVGLRMKHSLFKLFKKRPNMEHEKDKVATDHENQLVQENHPETEVTENQPEQVSASAATGAEKLTAELQDAKDKYLRLYADFENFRRRTAKEKMEFVSSAQGELMKALLPVLDDFERGLKAAKAQEGSAAREGMELIYHKLYKTLEQKGLKPMETVGAEFNPDLHEAITQVPAPQDNQKGKVIDEVEKGYYLHDKVLRFAKVIVGA